MPWSCSTSSPPKKGWSRRALPHRPTPTPQYLLTARAGVYDRLAEKYPAYEDLKAVVSNPKCRVFVIRPSFRQMIEQARNAFASPLPVEQAA